MVSIIIPYYNAAETLRQAVESVCRTDYPNYEIITVDDGSEDDSFETIADLPCIHVRNTQRSGAAVTRNIGAQACSGSILFFMDADVVMLPDTLRRAVRNFNDDDGLAAVFGEYTLDTVPGNFVSQYKNMVHHYTHQTSDEQAATFWSGCGAIRTDIFHLIGRFNEGYSAASVEDIELGYRLYQNKQRIRLDKSIRVTHAKRYTLWSLIKSDLVYRAIPWTKLMARRGIFRADLNLKPHNIFSGIILAILIPWAIFVSAKYLHELWYLLPAMAFLMLLLLNIDIFSYVYRFKGLRFLFCFVIMYTVTYIYSLLGFALGLLLYVTDVIRGRGNSV